MAGLYDTDIRLDDSGELTPAMTGDAPICFGTDCFIQDIRLEAVTQPGELFYNSDWGWGLRQFIQEEDDDLIRLEISERIKEKLARREEIDAATILVTFEHQDDSLIVLVSFCLKDQQQLELSLELNRVRVEVTLID